MADRKYRFGLANTHYAIYNPATKEYGELKALPGAVALNLSAEGGNGSDFYADNGIWATFAGTNGGYSGDLELANIPDSARVDLLGEIIDDGTGMQFEITGSEPPEFALVTEMMTSNDVMAFTFYNCKATRPGIVAKTKGESPDVDTETISLRIGSREFTYKGEKKTFVQGHIEKTDANTAKYAAMFASVVPPTATA